jgi:hypothetical protein
MLTDKPYWDEDCQAWLTVVESVEHAAIGHQIKEAQKPIVMIPIERRHHHDNPPDHKEAAWKPFSSGFSFSPSMLCVCTGFFKLQGGYWHETPIRLLRNRVPGQDETLHVRAREMFLSSMPGRDFKDADYGCRSWTPDALIPAYLGRPDRRLLPADRGAWGLFEAGPMTDRQFILVLCSLGILLISLYGCAPTQHPYRRSDSVRMRMHMDAAPAPEHEDLEGKVWLAPTARVKRQSALWLVQVLIWSISNVSDVKGLVKSLIFRLIGLSKGLHLNAYAATYRWEKKQNGGGCSLLLWAKWNAGK